MGLKVDQTLLLRIFKKGFSRNRCITTENAVVNRTGLDQEQVTAIISRSLEVTRLTMLCVEWRRIHVEEELVLQASELYDLTQASQGTVAIY